MFDPALILTSLGLSAPDAQNLLATISIVVGSGVVVWLLSRFIRGVARLAGGRPSTDRSIRDFFSVLWLAIIALSVLTIWNLTSVFSFLTVGGIAGLIVSLALQSTLSNMLAGFFLFRDQLIHVGDDIEYSSMRGRVIRVALRNTWLLTKEGKVVVIGNTSLSSGPLINHTASPVLAAHLGEAPRPAATPAAASAAAPAAASATPTPATASGGPNPPTAPSVPK